MRIYGNTKNVVAGVGGADRILLDNATGPRMVRVYNDGLVTVFVRLGIVTDTVSASNGVPIATKDSLDLSIRDTVTHLIAIAASTTATVYATEMTG